MRKKIVAGNWKMNMTLASGKQLVDEVLEGLRDLKEHQEVIFAPPYVYLSALSDPVKEKHGVKLAAQNCHQEEKGAFTGEISAQMLASMGVTHVIIGHSERRMYFSEDSAMLKQKVAQALQNGLIPIFCCGEPLITREAGQHFELVEKQISEALFQLPKEKIQQLIIAYEPVWAIGTGKTATADQAQEMHLHIRSLVKDKYGEAVADNLPILYGGSCKPSNAGELFGKSEVDGGLIGGASLKADDFLAIIKHLS